MTYQILCLSGGGYLGLYTAEVLARIEAATKRPVVMQFDLIAGTSIGGVIALALAAGKTAVSIRETLVSKGPKIFSVRPPPQSGIRQKLDLRLNARKAKYSSAPLRAALEEFFDPSLKVGELRRRVIVPTVNLTKGSPQVFKTPHHPTFVRDLNVSVIDVALATSAAPTFFPIHRIDGELFADGGLYANSPDHLALHEAEHFLDWPLNEIRILSVGTTTSKFSFSAGGGLDMGWIAWLSGQRLPNVMIAAQQMNTDYMLRHRLRENYLRIDQPQSKEQERQLGLDIASEAARIDLAGLAEASVREHLPGVQLRTMLQHTAEPPRFFAT